MEMSVLEDVRAPPNTGICWVSGCLSGIIGSIKTCLMYEMGIFRPIMSNHIYRPATFLNSERLLDPLPLSVPDSVSRVVAAPVISDHERMAGMPERRLSAEGIRPLLVPLTEIGRAIEGRVWCGVIHAGR